MLYIKGLGMGRGLVYMFIVYVSFQEKKVNNFCLWFRMFNFSTGNTKVENPSNWISLEKMMEIGRTFARDSLQKSDLIDRVDVRPEKGIAKIVFKRHFTEIQVDGFSGEILSVSQRNSDLIEKIHDGSILDFLLESESEFSKITYSTLTSVVLLLLCFTGFFLWYLPKMIKKFKNRPAP